MVAREQLSSSPASAFDFTRPPSAWTRQQRAQLARALRSAMRTTEIAGRLGVTPSTVRDYLSDPDGELARARRQKPRGVRALRTPDRVKPRPSRLRSLSALRRGQPRHLDARGRDRRLSGLVEPFRCRAYEHQLEPHARTPPGRRRVAALWLRPVADADRDRPAVRALVRAHRRRTRAFERRAARGATDLNSGGFRRGTPTVRAGE